MYKIPLADIKAKLAQSGKITAAELDQRMKDKINDLSGLISEEGAAHIIANELGVELFNTETAQLKIKEIYAGMRNVATVGKVVRKFEMREFSKGDKTGKVCSLVLGDETGTIRVVFWNEQVEHTQKINEGDVLQIKEAYVRENNENKEIHIGERSQISINPADVVVNTVRQKNSFERKTIAELQDGQEGVELIGTIVQVFDPRFFSVCSQCAKKVQEAESGHNCVDHGTVQPTISYVLNATLDDGSSTIRGVFWKNQANHLIGKSEADMAAYRENMAAFEHVKTDLLGEQVKVMGRVKRNQYFDRLEFNAQLVEKANPEEELARLEKQV
ncbi:MAG TPA: OB-fold nucleic acid binding domain-containing protein [Candidatus Nanoarchaeia archaeon]|nr:OB-fold nucleic acid binding domain-containing protein [Candidatus Nanoarchaeia archaeon]